MNRLRFVAGILFIGCPLACVGLTASTIGVSSYTSLWSKYMWRGLRFSNGSVLQTNLTASYQAFSASLWSNYDFKTGKINEVDPTLNYAWSNEQLGLNIGWNHFGVVHGRDNDEVYVAATMNKWFLTPTVSCFIDLDYGKGSYWQLGLAHSFELTPQLKLNLTANAGLVVNDRYLGLNARGDEFTDFFSGDIMASLPLDLGKGFSLEPRIGYAFPLSKNAREAISSYGFGTDASTLYGALVLNYAF